MNRMKLLSMTLGFFVCTSAMGADPAVADKTGEMMQDSQRLVQAGKFAEAYALMQPFEFEKSGDASFDYLYGISALNAGQPDMATLALERVATVNPNFGEVRTWLGVAYFQSGDLVRAKPTLIGALAQPSLSAQSKVTANQYLEKIQQLADAKSLAEEKAKQAYWLGAVEFGLGRDSNMTTVSNNVSGTPAASGLAGGFAHINGNVEFRKPLFEAGTFGFLSMDSSNRAYPSQNNMNSYTTTLKGGLNWQSGENTYRFNVAHRDDRQQGLNAASNNNSAQNTLASDVRLGLSQADWLGFSVQLGATRFTKIAAQDTNQIVLGTNYMHSFQVTGAPLIHIALSHARDVALNSIVPLSTSVTTTDVSRNTNNVLVYSQYTFVPSADVTGMWMSSRRTDTQSYARSATEAYGKDDMSVLLLGVNWRPAKDWLVKPQVMKLDNKSTIAGYAFTKNEVSVSVKREFK